MRTVRILEATVERPMHALSDEELIGKSVSSSSGWYSPVWLLDNETHGQSKWTSAIKWNISLSDGSELTDGQHPYLLAWLRRVVWSLFSAPGNGYAPIKPGTASRISAGLARIVPWLVDNNIRSPHELTQNVLDRLLEDLPEKLATFGGSDEQGEEDEATVTRGAVHNALYIIFYVWRQRRCLEEAGIASMPGKPWPQVGSVNSFSKQITRRVMGWIRPLQDEVAVPILNRAMWFMGEPSRDVLNLESAVRAAYSCETGDKNTNQRDAAIRFVFSTMVGDSAPWVSDLANRKLSDGSSGVMFHVMKLVIDLQTACCLLLQGCTGMRVSELCGLRAGIDAKTGWPIDVEMRLSPTGLNEEFILTGEISKGQRSPRDVPWLLGSRRYGDKEIPLPVRAMIVVDTLLRPYREMLGSVRLLVSLNGKVGLPKTKEGVARITGNRILAMYRDFILRWVDLSALPDQSQNATSSNDLVEWRETKGTRITTHQLRKTYALYVLSVHPDLLPAVKRQFHHLNMAITESGYWGSNAPQIEPIHSISRQLTARMLFEVVHGNSVLGGKMGGQIVKNLDELRSMISGLNLQGAWGTVYRWVEANEIHVNHSAHGACVPLVGSRMECWKRADEGLQGTLEPNYKVREASLCAGCACFAMNAKHLPFWRDRYLQYEVALRQALELGIDGADHRVLRNRVDQAKKILIDVGDDIANLDALVDLRVADYAHERN